MRRRLTKRRGDELSRAILTLARTGTPSRSDERTGRKIGAAATVSRFASDRLRDGRYPANETTSDVDAATTS